MDLLTPAQAQTFADSARLAKEPLGLHLVGRGVITPTQLCQALSLQTGLPVVDLPDSNVPVAKKYSKLAHLMARFEMVPFSETEQVICVACRRPPSPQRVPEIEKAFGKKVRVCLAADEQIGQILKSLGPSTTRQKRKHARYRVTMPIWVQLCGPRNEPLSPKHGGQILDISASGLRIEAPDVMLEKIKELRTTEPKLYVQFCTPPLEVVGTCILRHARRKDSAKSWESLCVLGLELIGVAAPARENLRKILDRAEIGVRRLEVEFGTDHL
jgi:hypothetical protein